MRSRGCKYEYRSCPCLNVEVLQYQEIDKKKKKKEERERTLGGKEQSKKYNNYERVGPGSNMKKKMVSEKGKLII